MTAPAQPLGALDVAAAVDALETLLRRGGHGEFSRTTSGGTSWRNPRICPICGSRPRSGDRTALEEYECGIGVTPRGMAVKCWHDPDARWRDVLVALGSSMGEWKRLTGQGETWAQGNQRRLLENATAMAWLQGRGISRSVIEAAGLGLTDPECGGGKVGHMLILPLRGPDGAQLVHVSSPERRAGARRWAYIVVPEVTPAPAGTRKKPKDRTPGHTVTHWVTRRRPTHRTLLLCEGMKDAWRVASVLEGTPLEDTLCVVTGSHGTGIPAEWRTGNWWAGWDEVLLGQDRDGPGEDLAKAVAALIPPAIPVRRVQIPEGLPSTKGGQGKDLTDALLGREGADALAVLQALIAGAVPAEREAPLAGHAPTEPRPTLLEQRATELAWTPGWKDRVDALLAEPEVSEDWLARLFLAACGDHLRYAVEKGEQRWYVWDSSAHRWLPDVAGVVVLRRALEFMRELRGTAGLGDDVRKLIGRSGDARTLRSVLDIARAGRTSDGQPIAVTAAEWFQTDPEVLPVANGIVDLRTGAYRPARPEDRVRAQAGVAFDPKASCPRWIEFVREITGGDEDDYGAYLQRLVGYTMTGYVRERLVPILLGRGGDGKTVLLETMRSLLGGLARTTPFTTFAAGRHSEHRNDIHRLQGARFVTAVETSERTRLDEPVFKLLAGGDTVAARALYTDGSEFKPTFTVWLATNQMPSIHGDSRAVWSRIVVLPMDLHLPEELQDKTLTQKLLAELPGILNWALEGARLYLAQGLGTRPWQVRQASSEARSLAPSVTRFVEEECVLEPGAAIPSSALYDAYVAWAKGAEYGQPLTQTAFMKLLAEVDGVGLKKTNRGNVRTGIRLYDPRRDARGAEAAGASGGEPPQAPAPPGRAAEPDEGQHEPPGGPEGLAEVAASALDLLPIDSVAAGATRARPARRPGAALAPVPPSDEPSAGVAAGAAA